MSAAARPVATVRKSVTPALRLLFGLAISGLFLYALLSKAPLRQVGAALDHANLGWIAASLLGICLSYTLKTQRWAVMLRSLGGQVGIRQALTPLMGSVALNNVLPFRAGDVVRVMAFRRYTGVQPSMQLGTVILERLLDIAALLAILLAVTSIWRVADLGAGVLTAMRLIAGLALVAMIGFICAPRPLRLLVGAAGTRLKFAGAGEALLRFSDALARLSSPTLLAKLAAFSLLAWLSEGLAYIAVARGVGAPDPVGAGLLALGLGTLSTTIPSSPGYVGTFHYFAAIALMRMGADQATATAFAILIHGILWLSTTSVGFVLMLLDRPRDDVAAAATATGPAAAPEEGSTP